MLAALFSLLLSTADAGELAGVAFPDTASVGGKTLVLNGIGLREKYYIDVYVGALYLEAKTTNALTAISQDQPKRIVMTFIYSAVTKDQLGEAFAEGLAHLPNKDVVADQFEMLAAYMTDVKSGDSIVFDYVPGKGTTITVKGVPKGTIAGTEFMKALWSVYLGTAPPTEKLKTGMLGK